MKKIIMLLSIFLFCLMSMGTVNAIKYSNFGGSTGYTYTTVSGPDEKQDNLNIAQVDWNYSNKGSYDQPYKMWFKVVNGPAYYKGSRLFDYLKDWEIETKGTAKGFDYYLQAGRENIVDPKTYVSGEWAS